MEQQTEKDFRFENDPQAEVFLLSEKNKRKSTKHFCLVLFVVQLRNQNPNHFPLLWIPLLFQKEWSVYPLYS